MTGQSQGLPLVVVGGWGVDAAMLGPVVAGWPGQVHYVSLTDNRLASCDSVSDVADSLTARFPGPAIWLGWSQGAQVVMAAAGLPGSPVTKVVTLAGFPRFARGKEWPCGMSPETFEAFENGLKRDAGRTWRRFQQLLVHGCPESEASQARRDLMSWLAEGPQVSDERLGQGLRWLASEDQRHLWRRLQTPALHLLGEADALVSPWNEDLALPESSGVRVIPMMTHWPRGSLAGECGQVIAEFAGIEETE